MKDRILKWSRKEYTKRQRMLALIPQATLFVAIVPSIFWVFSYTIDDHFRLPKFVSPDFIAVFLILPGLLFAGWSVWAQFKIGKGTPAPMMPTQKLVVEGPYAYCRNPMIFGIMLFYLGIGVWMGSFSFIGLVILFVVSLLVYVKLVEEKELEERFGQEYVEYKKRTPFLLPVPSKKHG
ncbi:hypothetical protein DRP07_03015 [Archaeoglobales archaeon]|nr:MAG: hypothetical protein DRP07_03015 [Archaeoglobales archaeon]